VSAKYLLPCLCGQNVAIEPRQAGETIACQCGASLQAPTMREICDLEPAPPDAASLQSGTSWGWRHGLKVLGAAITLLAIGWIIWLYANPPASVFDVFDSEMIQRDFAHLPPVLTWDNWQKAREGLDRRVDQRYADEVAVYHVKQTLCFILAIIGAALIAAGALAKPRPATSATEAP
jgi:hypothetical protein